MERRRKKKMMMRRRRMEKVTKKTEQRRASQILLKEEMLGKDNLAPLQVCGRCPTVGGIIILHWRLIPGRKQPVRKCALKTILL